MKKFLLFVLLIVPNLAYAEGLKLLSLSTLIGQLITFAILIWVMKKFVWPPLMGAIETRQKEIADGLAAGEQGRRELDDADKTKAEILQEARQKSSGLISDAEQRKVSIIEAAKQEAEVEKARIIERGRRELEAERVSMNREIEDKIGGLVVAGASQILQREVDAKLHNDIIESLKKTG